MVDVIYTPFDLAEPVKAGRRRFWKQVLPVTKINYKGQEVNFDPKFHMDLAQSFRDEAFDQVPVVFADADNRHNMDPRNFGGDVLDMQYRGASKNGGTWALIEADKDAARAIKKNPRLGVSARIRQMVEKADGRTFPRAIEHLCLTMNPRVTGMGPWQAVDLSDEDDSDIEVVDLTAATYEKGTGMATKTKARKQRRATTSTGRTIDLSNLSDEQFEQLLDLSAAALEDVDLDEDLDEDEVEDEPRRRPRRKKSKTKVTIEKDSEDDGDPDEDEDLDDEDFEDEDEDDEDEVTDRRRQRRQRRQRRTDLSDDDADHVIRDDERTQFQQMRYDLAEERWEKDRRVYIAGGVPPALLDLAEPVLVLPDALTIDLSDDEDPIDATDTIRKMLDSVKGYIDLTGETGHAFDLTDEDEDGDETDAFLDAWDKQYG